MKDKRRETTDEKEGGNEEMECDEDVMESKAVTAAQMFTCFYAFLQYQMEAVSVETCTHCDSLSNVCICLCEFFSFLQLKIPSACSLVGAKACKCDTFAHAAKQV